MHILSISTISNHSSIFGRIFTIFGQIKSNMADRGNPFLVGALSPSSQVRDKFKSSKA